MKMLMRSVLAMELILICFALLIAKDQTIESIYFGFAILLLNILALASLRNRWGWFLGWLVQVALILYGFFIFMMFFMGALFLGLWITAISVGRKGEEIKRAREGESSQ